MSKRGKAKTVEKILASIKKEELTQKSTQGMEPIVQLRGIIPTVSENSEEYFRQLLEKMGYEELIDKAWIFKSPSLVSEIFGKKVSS